LIAATGLPALNVRQIRRWHTTVAAAVIAGGLVVSQAHLLLGWFLIGLSCGMLGYLATLTAALHSNPSYAFPVRLGITLCIAGTVAAIFRLMPMFSYATTVDVIGMALVLLALGIGLQLPIKPPAARIRSHGDRQSALVLAVLFFLFVGQNGMLAFALQQGNDRGLTFGQTLWALAIIKIAAGLGLKGDLFNACAKLVMGVYKTWWESDASMVEINPLCVIETTVLPSTVALNPDGTPLCLRGGFAEGTASG